jgi:hypothetical protein
MRNAYEEFCVSVNIYTLCIGSFFTIASSLSENLAMIQYLWYDILVEKEGVSWHEVSRL